MIAAGERAIRLVSNYDGFFTCLYHPECRRAEVMLNRMHRTRWNDPDDWYQLSDLETDDWPWLIANCPVVAVRMNATMLRYRERMDERASRLMRRQAAFQEGKPA